VPSGGGILPLRPRARRDKGTKIGSSAATMEGPCTVLVRALRKAIRAGKGNMPDDNRGTESAMRMVLPNLFGLYNDAAHRGLVTCQGTDAGGRETKSFMASRLTKITLPHGCSAETDTHIFAAANDGFSRSENDYTVSYVWPFDPSTLTPGLDTKKFSDIIKRNLTRLANNTRHNIPLEVALRTVGAEYGVPLNMNDVLDEHHYVTVPIITVIIVIILTIAIIFGVRIVRNIAKSKRQDQFMMYMKKRQDILIEAMRYREEEEEGRGRMRPRKPMAPQPPQTESYSQPPSYATAGRGRPGYAETPQSPTRRTGASLGVPLSLVAELQEHGISTAGHSLGMKAAGLQEEAASMLRGLNIDRDQVATKNYPRGAPVAINMVDMMERR
jgi:hypothetical protein